jgi:hypothetical protein
LDLDGNPALQREIAYWWATQAVDPTSSTEIFGTPTEVLDRLIGALKPGVKETYTVGVRQEGKGGHAVTPYAVEDKGGGIVDVLVYDNNHPNVERRLTVDRTKNTWQFSLSTNPAEPESIWAGDAATRSFSLSPSSPRLQTQVAPFLAETVRAVALNALGQPRREHEEILKAGRASIEDLQAKLRESQEALVRSRVEGGEALARAGADAGQGLESLRGELESGFREALKAREEETARRISALEERWKAEQAALEGGKREALAAAEARCWCCTT